MNHAAQRLFYAFVMLPVLFACGDNTQTAKNTNSDYTLCECVNYPPTTDEKVAACSAIIESIPVEQLVAQSRECRSLIAVPAGGPDICYCMSARSDDPEVQQACVELAEQIEPNDMLAITRQCAVERVDDARKRL